MIKIKIIAIISILFFSGGQVWSEMPHAPDKKKFRFIVNADPQMGPQLTDRRGLKILNLLLEGFVEDVNKMHEKKPIDFVVYDGDLVWDPYQDAFDNFTRIVSAQKPPVVLVHGNHDGYDDDPKFFQAQQKLSGYQKLNYSFAYGDWKFVVIGAQEKYRSKVKQKAQLDWIRHELEKYKDDKVMLFMHYHIMPVGLSQTEYYTYWPVTFKNQILDLITQHGNVKYVFNGHVHTGVKASIKSSVEYKGTTFINAPTPVFARMFGEEYPEFDELGRFDKRGFYMEVEVDGDKVTMNGRKIHNKNMHKYPETFKSFQKVMDPRNFIPESRSKFRKKLVNGGFGKKFKGWKKSYRYQTDGKPTFQNIIQDGVNIMDLTASYGSWSFDEYMETYQTVALDLKQNNYLKYKFRVPKMDKRGAGGYIRIFSYSKKGEMTNSVIFHWGHKEEFARNVSRSWAYNAIGDRLSLYWPDEMIKKSQLISFKLDINNQKIQELDIDINALFKLMQAKQKPQISLDDISHMTIAHGVWTRVNQKGTPYRSRAEFQKIKLSHDEDKVKPISPVVLNQKKINVDSADKQFPYIQFYYKLREKKLKQKQSGG